MNRHIILIISAVILSVIFQSCGGIKDQPDLGLVNGTVTFEGEPLADASVTFFPDDGRPASGKTDANGKYELIYIRKIKGCKLGNNKVVIRSRVEPEDENGNEGDSDGDDGKAKLKPRSKHTNEILPRRYNSQSELTAQVEQGTNTFDFQLTK